MTEPFKSSSADLITLLWSWEPYQRGRENAAKTVAMLQVELQAQCLNFEPLIDPKGLEFVTVCQWLKNSVVALNNFQKASPWHQLQIIEKLYGAAHAQSSLAFRRLQ